MTQIWFGTGGTAGDPQDLANWYTDAGKSTPYGAIPTTGDEVFLTGVDYPTANFGSCALLGFDSTGLSSNGFSAAITASLTIQDSSGYLYMGGSGGQVWGGSGGGQSVSGTFSGNSQLAPSGSIVFSACNFSQSATINTNQNIDIYGNSTVDATILITAGTINIYGASTSLTFQSSSSTGAGTINVLGNGAALNINNGCTLSGTTIVSVAANANINFGSGSNWTSTGTLTNAGVFSTSVSLGIGSGMTYTQNSGGSLTGGGLLQATGGTVNLNSGTLTLYGGSYGTLNVASSTTLSVAGGANHLQGGTITNHGTINVSGTWNASSTATNLTNYGAFNTGAAVSIASSMTYNQESGGDFSGSSANWGTASGGTVYIDSGSASFANGIGGGTMTIASGATLTVPSGAGFSGGTVNNLAGGTFAIAGTGQWNTGGTLENYGSFTYVANFGFTTSCTWHHYTGATHAFSGTFQIQGGTLVFNAAETLVVDNGYTSGSLTIGSAATCNFTTAAWSGGDIACAGTVSFATGSHWTGATTLTNTGSLTYTDALSLSSGQTYNQNPNASSNFIAGLTLAGGAVNVDYGQVIFVGGMTSGVLTATSSGSGYFPTGGNFSGGTITLSGGSTALQFASGAAWNTAGTIANSGTFTYADALTLTSGQTYTQNSGGSCTFTTSLQLNGGAVNINDGTITFVGGITGGSVLTLTGTGAATIPTGATMSSGTVTIGSSAAITFANGGSWTGGSIDNYGLFTYSETTGFSFPAGTVYTQETTGTNAFAGAVSITGGTINLYGSTLLVNNTSVGMTDGIVTVTGSAAVTFASSALWSGGTIHDEASVTFNTFGITIASPCIFNLYSTGSLTLTGNTNQLTTGTLNIMSGSYTMSNSSWAGFTGAGNITIYSGATFTLGSSVGWTAGEIHNIGTFHCTPAATIASGMTYIQDYASSSVTWTGHFSLTGGDIQTANGGIFVFTSSDNMQAGTIETTGTSDIITFQSGSYAFSGTIYNEPASPPAIIQFARGQDLQGTTVVRGVITIKDATPIGSGVSVGTGGARFDYPIPAGTANASSTASAVGVAGGGVFHTGTGTASASSTASAVGKSLFKSHGNPAASSTASAVGKSLDLSHGTAAASSTASAVGKSLDLSHGTAAASSTASAIGKSLDKSHGTAAASSTASGHGKKLVPSIGTSEASSTVTGRTNIRKIVVRNIPTQLPDVLPKTAFLAMLIDPKTKTFFQNLDVSKWSITRFDRQTRVALVRIGSPEGQDQPKRAIKSPASTARFVAVTLTDLTFS